MVNVTVLLFARARELAGQKQLDNFDVKAPATVHAFMKGIVELLPALGEVMESCGVAVNQEYVDEDHALQVSVARATVRAHGCYRSVPAALLTLPPPLSLPSLPKPKQRATVLRRRMAMRLR